MGLGHLCFVIGSQSLVARQSAPHEQDRNFGHFAIGAALGQLVGPVAAGTLIGAEDMAGSSALALVVAGATAAVAFTSLWRIEHPPAVRPSRRSPARPRSAWPPSPGRSGSGSVAAPMAPRRPRSTDRSARAGQGGGALGPDAGPVRGRGGAGAGAAPAVRRGAGSGSGSADAPSGRRGGATGATAVDRGKGYSGNVVVFAHLTGIR